MLKVKNTPSNDFELEPWEVDLYDMHNDMVLSLWKSMMD